MSLEISSDGITKLGGGAVSLRPMPAFHVYLGTNQSFATGEATTVQYNTVVFDTENWFNTSTYRYTPQIAGYYQFTACCLIQGTGLTRILPSFLINDTTVYRIAYIPVYEGGTTDSAAINGSALVYMNGSTDYITVSAFATASSALILSAANTGDTYFCGFLVRSS